MGSGLRRNDELYFEYKKLAGLDVPPILFLSHPLPTPFVIPPEGGTHEAHRTRGVAVGSQVPHAVFGIRH